MANLTSRAPELNQTVQRLGDFSQAATPALRSLGDAADQGRETFPRIMRLATQLDELGTPLAPLAKDLAELGDSFDRTGGISSILRLLYFYTASLNGKDGTAHYIRTNVVPDAQCLDRAAAPGACVGRFVPQEDAETRAATRAGTSDVAKARKQLQTLLGPEGTR